MSIHRTLTSPMTPRKMKTTDLVEHFAIFCRQEKEVYQCIDYLSPDYQTGLEQKAYIQFQVNSSSLASSSLSSTSSSTSRSISEMWRDKICEWTFKVIDHFEIKREVASISMNYLDRYLSIHTVDMKTFQLASMTSLFLAVKLYESTTLSVSSLIELSCGNFETEHITSMENSILWCVSYCIFIFMLMGTFNLLE